MAITFEIRVDEVTRNSVLLDLLAGALGFLDDPEPTESVISFMSKASNKQRQEAIVNATKPNMARFYNPDPKTDVCQKLNNKTYRIGIDPIDYPPIHWNCESNIQYYRSNI